MADKLGPINIEFLINHPEVIQQAQQVKRELKGIQTSGTQSARSITTEYTKSQGIIHNLETNLVSLRQKLKDATNTTSIQNYNKAIAVLEDQLRRLQTSGLDQIGLSSRRAAAGLDASTRSSNQAGFALMNLGRVAQDAPYGFIGIQNNLNPLLESFQQLRASAGSNGAALKLMVAGLAGPAGLGVAISVVTGLITTWVMRNREAKQSTEELKNENEELLKSFNDLEAATLKGEASAARNVAELKALYTVSQDNARSLDERRKAAEKLHENYPKAFANYRTEEILVGKASAAYLTLTNNLLAAARASAYFDEIANRQKFIANAELEKKALKERKELIEANIRESIKLNEGQREFGGEVLDLSSLFGKDADKYVERNKKIQGIDKEITDLGFKIIKAQQDQKTFIDEASKLTVDQITGDVTGKSGSDGKPDKNAEKVIASRRKLLQRLADLDADFARKGLEKDAAEIQAVRDKYSEIRRIIDDFNRDPRNKNAQIDVGALNLPGREESAVANVRYRQETDELKDSLEKQKQLYQEYEEFKTSFGEEKARERYASELDLSKTYMQKLQDEYAGLMSLSVSPTGLTGPQQERMDFLSQAIKAEVKESEQAMNELLKATQTYQEKRRLLEEQYQASRKKLIEAGKFSELAVLADQHRNELDQLDDANVRKLDAFRKLFDGVERMSAGTARMVITVARQQLDELVKSGRISDELASDITEKLRRSTASIDRRLPDGLSAISRELRDIARSVGDTNDGFGAVLDTLGEITGRFGQMIDSLNALKNVEGLGGIFGEKGIGGLLDGGLGKVGDFIEKVGAIAKPVGAVVGVVTSVVNLFTGLNKRTKQMNAQARAEIQKFYDQAIQGERDYQALLRDRDRDTVRRNKLTYEGVVAELELLKDQTPELESAYNRVFAAIQGQDFVSGQGFRHATWFRKAKTWDIMSSLAGSDYARLEKLYTEGKLKDQAKADFEELRRLKEELESVGVSIQDVQAELNELLTGTTVTGLADQLARLAASGHAEFADLAQSFEDVMRGAIENSFKYRFLEEQFAPFYSNLAAAFENGIPGRQTIDQLRTQYEQIAKGASDRWKAIEQATGISFEDQQREQTGMAGAIKGITADQADLLAGQFGGLRLAQLEAVQLHKQGNAMMHQQMGIIKQQILISTKIEANTKVTADNSEQLSYLKRIYEKMDENNNALKSRGI